MFVSCLCYLVLQCEVWNPAAFGQISWGRSEAGRDPEPLRMYVQYSGGQLPYYAQPAQYQQYQPAYGAVSQPVQSVMQMPQMPQMPMQQYPATYSGFSGGAYMAPAYGQPQLAQYGQQPQAQPQPQYAQLQYQPQVQPQVQPLQSGMAEGAYGQVLAIASQSDSIHMRHQAPCAQETRVPPHHDQSRDEVNMFYHALTLLYPVV